MPRRKIIRTPEQEEERRKRRQERMREYQRRYRESRRRMRQKLELKIKYKEALKNCPTGKNNLMILNIPVKNVPGGVRHDLRILWYNPPGQQGPLPKSSAKYGCEDHFNLKNGAVNWMHYKTADSKLAIKKDVLPQLCIITTNKPLASTSQFSPESQARKNTILMVNKSEQAKITEEATDHSTPIIEEEMIEIKEELLEEIEDEENEELEKTIKEEIIEPNEENIESREEEEEESFRINFMIKEEVQDEAENFKEPEYVNCTIKQEEMENVNYDYYGVKEEDKT